ncbi:transient receptor potential ion channel [Zalerion maritima]|uniref:Transient receptor potential ion channel n=1 Tax=Zalerion maritima TaxID=339359 RepID=A0AAD5WSY5_9PEZI|nr:transient receptor potential ion channel [Zalerion maritima]
MRFSLWKPLLGLASLASSVYAEALLQSTSLNTCQENSSFTASLFNVVFTPGNNSATISVVAVSSVQGNVKFDVQASAYGYAFLQQTIDPCDVGLAGLCPMTSGKLDLDFNIEVSDDAVNQIPGIAYSVPDLDATVRVYLNLTDSGESVSCVEADISNGKTVNLTGVKWATACVAGLALCASAVVSGLGHSNTAAHVASNALSLFGYFQAQAIVGMVGVHVPPIVRAWTQDFQWSMGIIKINWMQSIFTWYQRATGGTPTELFSSLGDVSVQVEKVKRSLSLVTPDAVKRSLSSITFIDTGAVNLFKRGMAMLPRDEISPIAKRSTILQEHGSYIVYGIQRVGFVAGIEISNIFMTGLSFFCIFVVLTVMSVAAFKGVCELSVKKGWMKSDRFLEFRNGWFTVLKGILFRMTLIGFPQIVILCLWEFTQKDSAAEIVLAVFFFFGMSATLGWAAFKVVRIARRSVTMHRNPAYILFSDPQALNKWGFLYVQFRASAYYFVVPVLAYTVVKGAFVAFAQHSPIVSAVSFVLIEAGALIGASVLRPWMDKSTNTMNIAICVINFLNAIFLLIFSDVFGQPSLVSGVVGVVLFVANAVFSLVLLIVIIVSTTITFFRKNPDTRYQFMADDRASFMKSQTQLTTTTELDALAATARGDKAGFKSGLDLDDDNESISSDSLRRRMHEPSMSSTSGAPPSYGNQPATPSTPYLPADRPAPPQHKASYDSYSQPSGSYLQSQNSGPARSPSPYGGAGSLRAQNNASPAGYRSQNNASPWQRGAGYDN